MTRLSVKFSGKRAPWKIQFGVNGQVQPADVFACRDGLEPLLRGLSAAESEYLAVLAGAGSAAGYSVPSIAVTLPSGRVLTFTLREVQESFAEEIQPSAGIR